MAFVIDFLLFKLRLVKMNYRWKCQCCTADSKAYKAVQNLYLKCILKAEFLRLSRWKDLSSYYYGKEMTGLIVSKILINFILNHDS